MKNIKFRDKEISIKRKPRIAFKKRFKPTSIGGGGSPVIECNSYNFEQRCNSQYLPL